MKFDFADLLTVAMTAIGFVFGQAWLLLLALLFAFSVFLARVPRKQPSGKAPGLPQYFSSFLLVSFVAVWLFLMFGFWITGLVGLFVMAAQYAK